jgi:RNA polymerase sigma-70 factor (ECF subfamily)
MAQRSNHDWVQALRGDCGDDAQRSAHQDLARYLYVVAYNYLRLRQADLYRLADFAAEELAALAEDFVQETLEKLARDGFALLGRYNAAGNFTSWAAQIVRNQAAMELRKSYWTRRSPLPQVGDSDDNGAEPARAAELADPSGDVDPARQAQQQQVRDLVQRCVDRLPERYRVAVLNCLGDDVSADAVARALGTTANAVYLIIQRAKRQLRGCLEQSGLDRSALAVFA